MEIIDANTFDFNVEKTERVAALIECDLVSLLPDFLKNRNEDFKTLKNYIETKNFDGIRKIGHDLRGVPGAFGYDFLVELGHKIETAAQEKDVNSLSLLARRFDNLMKTHDIIIEGDSKIYHSQDFI